MCKMIHHYKTVLQLCGLYVDAKKIQIPSRVSKFYVAVLRKHMVRFSILYGGDFNVFTTLVMVVLSLESSLVSSCKACSNCIFTLFGSRFCWNKFKAASWWYIFFAKAPTEKDSERNVCLYFRAIFTGDWDGPLFPHTWNNSRTAQLYFSLCFTISFSESFP